MQSGETHTTVFEYQPPDRYRVVSDGASELVGIDGKVYQRDSGPWTESPVQSTTIVDPQFTNRLEQSITNLQFVGFETLNGVPMLVFEYHSSYKIGLSPAESQTRLWIGLDDGLIYQIMIDGQVAALDHLSGVVENSQAITTIVYEYDTGIQIEEPIVGK
jgi:hypothetical protein